MKKILILMLPIIMINIGCTNKKEKIFEEYARNYYEKHMKSVNKMNSATITLENLLNANKEEKKLNKLKKCKSTSKVIFNIDENKNIKKTIIELNC